EVCSRRDAWHGLRRSCLRFTRVLDREDDAWWQRGPATLSKRSRLGLCSILSGGTIGGFGDLGEIADLPVARSVLVRAFLWLGQKGSLDKRGRLLTPLPELLVTGPFVATSWTPLDIKRHDECNLLQPLEGFVRARFTDKMLKG